MGAGYTNPPLIGKIGNPGDLYLIQVIQLSNYSQVAGGAGYAEISGGHHGLRLGDSTINPAPFGTTRVFRLGVLIYSDGGGATADVQLWDDDAGAYVAGSILTYLSVNANEAAWLESGNLPIDITHMFRLFGEGDTGGVNCTIDHAFILVYARVI